MIRLKKLISNFFVDLNVFFKYYCLIILCNGNMNC